eukprot:Skav230414  [mRNA]  locus=scaffold4006:114788:116064:+ [translate_table: standard]
MTRIHQRDCTSSESGVHEAHAEKQHEAARLEASVKASRLQASLAEAEHQVQRQQAMARLQNEMTSKQQASMTLELKAAAEEATGFCPQPLILLLPASTYRYCK